MYFYHFGRAIIEANNKKFLGRCESDFNLMAKKEVN